VFSPYYTWARRRTPARPQNHVALNVVLYGRRKRWAMTERGEAALTATATTLTIGPSELHWDGTVLTIDLDEVTVPLPIRLRGQVRVHPAALPGQDFTLDAAGRHSWSPLAPVSRVEVALSSPGLNWSGPGYFDTNAGSAPLERDFVRWDWCRAPTAAGATILYNAHRREGGEQALALRVDRRGALDRHWLPCPARSGVCSKRPAPMPALCPGSGSVWRTRRSTLAPLSRRGCMGRRSWRYMKACRWTGSGLRWCRPCCRSGYPGGVCRLIAMEMFLLSF